MLLTFAIFSLPAIRIAATSAPAKPCSARRSRIACTEVCAEMWQGEGVMRGGGGGREFLGCCVLSPPHTTPTRLPRQTPRKNPAPPPTPPPFLLIPSAARPAASTPLSPARPRC